MEAFWQLDDHTKIPTPWVKEISQVLDFLDAATRPEDLAIPGWQFYLYAHNGGHRYAVQLSNSSWRLTFSWHAGDAVDVNLEHG
jgi:proteic killer suppression protein